MRIFLGHNLQCKSNSLLNVGKIWKHFQLQKIRMRHSFKAIRKSVVLKYMQTLMKYDLKVILIFNILLATLMPVSVFFYSASNPVPFETPGKIIKRWTQCFSPCLPRGRPRKSSFFPCFSLVQRLLLKLSGDWSGRYKFLCHFLSSCNLNIQNK